MAEDEPLLQGLRLRSAESAETKAGAGAKAKAKAKAKPEAVAKAKAKAKAGAKAEAKSEAKAKATPWAAAKGKGKGKGKGAGDAYAWQPLWPGDIVTLSRFDAASGVPSLGPLKVIGRVPGYRNGIIGLMLVKHPQHMLRITWQGLVDFNGNVGGPMTRFRSAGFRAGAGTGPGGGCEVALYGIRSCMWLAIQDNGWLCSSASRLGFDCRWVKRTGDGLVPPQAAAAEAPAAGLDAAEEETLSGPYSKDQAGQEAEEAIDDPYNEEQAGQDDQDATDDFDSEDQAGRDDPDAEDADFDRTDEKPLSSEAFWAKELQNPPVLELRHPPLHPLDDYLSHDVHVVVRCVDGLERVSEGLLLAAWAALLCRYGRAEELMVSVVSEGLRGPLAVRLPFSGEWPLSQLADIAANKILTATAHASALETCLAAHVREEPPLLQVGFAFGPLLSGTRLRQLALQQVVGTQALQLRAALDSGGRLRLQLLHVLGSFSSSSAERALAHLEQLLRAESACGCAELCPPLERDQLLRWSDATAEEYECHASDCVHEAFEALAVSCPQRLALVEDKRTMTYERLAAASAHVAGQLCAAGAEPDSLVPLMAHRSLEMIIGIFGILRAAAAYVPLDTKWPDDRLREVAAQCGARAACAGPGLRDRVAGLASVVVEVSADALPAAVVAGSQLQRSGGLGAVYCFFTSGSTGKPKGVVVEHRGLVHRIRWFQQRWGMSEGECGVLKHSYTFGLSEWEIFWPLSVGGTLVLCKPEGERDVEYIWRLTERHRVRTQVFVPSVLRALLEHAEMELQDSGNQLWPHLRAAITCGEALSVELANLFADIVPHATLDNLYGPTEGEMTVWRVPKGEILRSIPIGAPMGGSRVLLLAQGGALAAIGEPGEIHFGGQFIARGYLGAPELTEQKFVEDSHDGGHGGRLYASGDLARWREGGVMDFMGRADFQVKLRGFRIELGEVEEALRAGGAAAAACVLAGEAPQQRLVAYVAPQGVELSQLRAVCSRRLPHYMVPGQMVVLAELPRTASGKIDRRALPTPPPPSQAQDAGSFMAPRDELEAQILGVWAQVLGVPAEALSIEADWLLVGGNSLLAGRATALLRKELGLHFPGTAMYTHSSILRLAELARQLGGSTTEAPVARGAVATTLVPAAERYRGLSARRPFALAMGLLVAVVACALGDTGSLALRLTLVGLMYMRCGRLATALALPLLLALSVVLEAALCILLKHALVGRLRPGQYPLWSAGYFRWLLARHAVEKVRDRVSEFVSGTSVFVAFYRALGAHIGERVDLNDPELEEPDLVTLGDDVEVNHARFGTAGIMDGMLILGRVTVGSGCRVLPRAMLVMGSKLDDGCELGAMATSVGWLGSVGAVCDLGSSGIERITTQNWLRIVVGVPLLLLLHSVPLLLSACALERLWASTGGTWPFWVVAPAVYRHGHALAFFALVVLQKRLIVGALLPGARPKEGTAAWHSDAFRTWLHEQAVSARAFDDAMDPVVGSELMSAMYRLLGAHVGSRVQIDNFHVAEHDCVTIEDDAVLGSVISIHCAGYQGREAVHLHRGANVLDHGCLMPGTRVGERAVLGSATLAPTRSYFPPESVSTGQVGGRPVRLRFQASTEEQKVHEREALRRLNSPPWFWGFNALLVVAAALCCPLPLYVAAVTGAAAGWVWGTLGPALALAALLPMFFGVNVAVLVANWLLKHCLVGTYREGAYPFFGSYHVGWMLMLVLAGVMEDAVDALQGTELLCWYYRAMGAKVGRDCCLFGLAFEYDLLSIGDYCSIGWECDTTCHTVENMVIKLAPTRLDSYSSMLPHSMVSPGASLGTGAVVLENSQVLKGELVPPDECWAGLPAARCGFVSELVSPSQAPVSSDEREEARGAICSSTTEPAINGEGAASVEPATLEPATTLELHTTPEPLKAQELPEATSGSPTEPASNDDAAASVEPALELRMTPEPVRAQELSKTGCAALEEFAVVVLSDAAGRPHFMVEWLRNGALCLWAMGSGGLGGHLRVRRAGEVDCNGGRGPWAQFAPRAAGYEGVLVLKALATGLYVGIGAEGELVAVARATPLAVEQVTGPRYENVPQDLRWQRRQEEAQGLLEEQRRQAAYALQTSAQWGPRAKAKAKGLPRARGER